MFPFPNESSLSEAGTRPKDIPIPSGGGDQARYLGTSVPRCQLGTQSLMGSFPSETLSLVPEGDLRPGKLTCPSFERELHTGEAATAPVSDNGSIPRETMHNACPDLAGL